MLQVFPECKLVIERSRPLWAVLLVMCAGCLSAPKSPSTAFVELYDLYSTAMVSYFKDDSSALREFSAFMKEYFSTVDTVRWESTNDVCLIREWFCNASARQYVLANKSDQEVEEMVSKMSACFSEMADMPPPRNMQQLRAFVRYRDDRDWEAWLHPELTQYDPQSQPSQPELRWYSTPSVEALGSQ